MVDATADSPRLDVTKALQNYAPSPFDLLFDFVDRLPGHPWIFYGVLWVLLMLIELLVNETNSLSQPLYVVTLTAPFVLALMHWTDLMAAQALEEFRPAMDCTDEEYASLKYRLTTTPRLPTLIACLQGVVAGAVYYTIVPVSVRTATFQISDSVMSTHYHHFIGIVDLAAAFVLMYFLRHKMWIVREILSKWSRVDLFDLRRVYAFSRTTAFTAISLVVIVYLWIGNVAFLSQNMVLVFVLGSLLIAAAISFILPLTDTHRVLVAEKRRLMLENARRMEATATELRRRIDSDEIADMDNLFKTLHSLEIEHQTLFRVATWPWQPETARLVALAVLFPIALWLIQQIIRRLIAT
ncbi:MAG: hypothetical protein IT320_27295 [Anaerolineae bacterium]|nr:hypothetical protein [Anaerolineae bacterium]